MIDERAFSVGQRWLIRGISTGVIQRIYADCNGGMLILLQRDSDFQYHITRPFELSQCYTPDMIGKDLIYLKESTSNTDADGPTTP